MNYNYTEEILKYKRNKKLKGIFIGIGILLVALLGSTYAFFTYSKSLQAFTLTSSGITASFSSGFNQINITNGYPISDEFAIQNLNQLDYIDFTVSGNVEDEDQGLTYEIYLTENISNTLDSNYIKVYITDENGNQINSKTTPKIFNSLDNTTYSKDSSTGKVIYKLEGMPGNYSKNFRIYAWIDKDYEQNEISQEFSFYVNLYAYNSENRNGAYLIKKAALARSNDGSNCLTTVEEDGITYISGSKECINFNYVWWSGKMWRITAIYPDGAMKMITDNNITSIAFNESSVAYYDKTNGTKSYMFQWLNEDFLDTLYNQGIDVIDQTKYWNATMPADTNISTKPLETDATMIPTTISPIGLLNSYEYYKSYQNTTYGNGYLNIGYECWSLNPYSSSYVWYVLGYGYHDHPSFTYGARPSIIIKSNISLIGNGTSGNPYRIVGDKETGNQNELINTRLSGEYVKLKNENNEQVFRIVGIEDNTTKIVAMDYADNGATRKFATSDGSANTLWGSGTTTDTGTWYTYLNESYYPNLVSTYGELFDSSLYYLGTSGRNYKLSVCANTTSGNTKVCDKTTQTGTFNIGLLRYGEMFATQQGSGYSSSTNMWLINRYGSSYVWHVVDRGKGSNYDPTRSCGARPSINLSSSVKILSGTGLPDDPYIVGL